MKQNKIFIKQKCILCGEELLGIGNNALPFKDGRCCDRCYYKKVLPERLRIIYLEKEVKQ